MTQNRPIGADSRPDSPIVSPIDRDIGSDFGGLRVSVGRDGNYA
jgi:hypothetical protein